MNLLVNILEQQLFIFTLISIMVIVSVYKEHQVLDDVYLVIRRVVPNDQMFILIMSTIYGILPVPGRISIATGMFDTCTNEKKPRGELGILAYLATHHYYLWSPLEKSVIIVLASAGITYIQFLNYMGIYIAMMITMTVYYVLFIMGPVQILNFKKTGKTRVLDPLILIGGVMICCVGLVDVKLFFPIYGLYVVCRYKVLNIISRVDWKLIIIACVIISASTVIKAHSDQLIGILNTITTQYGLHVSLIASFTAALLLGSSSKFAAITALMVSIYGVAYLPIFYIFDFCGYLLSPSHKCVHIGRLYFKTKLVAFYKVVGIITLILMLTSIIKTLMINE